MPSRAGGGMREARGGMREGAPPPLRILRRAPATGVAGVGVGHPLYIITSNSIFRYSRSTSSPANRAPSPKGCSHFCSLVIWIKRAPHRPKHTRGRRVTGNQILAGVLPLLPPYSQRTSLMP